MRTIENFILKYIDKFLKILKTDRNTFFTYVLTLFSFYFFIDRIVEMLFMCFSGISVDYWGPFKYTFAYACVVFAFLFSFSSSFARTNDKKLSLFYVYCIALYVLFLSMIVQWMNRLGWVAIFFLPNYKGIVTEFSDLIKPAFTAMACYLPIITFFPFFRFLYTNINDSIDTINSIGEYTGIDLKDHSGGTGPYTAEMYIMKKLETGQTIKIPESKRFESTLIVGASGSGKTTMAFEPMIARDIEKKFFLHESSKELGFAALKTGIASLNNPYSNEYLNQNFSLNMLSVDESKSKLFDLYLKNLIYYSSGNMRIFRDLGLTYIAPDYETIDKMKNVVENYGFKYNLVDPNSKDSIGINPFAFKDPVKTSLAISSVLKRMYETNEVTPKEAYMQNITSQAIENLSLLLKEIYPKSHNGLLPTLEDLLIMLNNFDIVEQFCEKLKNYPELASKYNILLTYFKNNFYKDSGLREETMRALQPASAQLENLLRFPGIKNILCNRSYNINFDNVLANGEITLVCTRRGDVGAAINKAFGLFVILMFQHAVLSRPGNEKSRIPHFLYIDEFPTFICKATEDIFTIYRKYHVGAIISAQNLSQFGTINGDNYRQTILSNCLTKIVFGNATPEDNDWWEKEFGNYRKWVWNSNYDTVAGKYDDKLAGIKRDGSKSNYPNGKIQMQGFKSVIVKTKNQKGKTVVGMGSLDFLESKYMEKHKSKNFNFTKYASSAGGSNDDGEGENGYRRNRFNTEMNEDDVPIKYNTTDMKYFFDNENAISYPLNKKNKK